MAFKKVALPQLTSAVKPGITPGLSASTKPGFKRVDLGYKISYAQAPTQKAPVKPVPVALRTAPASAGGGRGTINRGVVSLDSLITANQKTIKVPNIGFGNTPEADAAYRASVRSGVTKIEPERHTNLVKGIAAGTIGLKATPASIVAGVARGSEIGMGKIVKKEVPANGLFGNTPEYEAAYKNWTASTGGPTVTDKDRADYVKATNAAVTADQRMLRVVAIVDKEMRAKPNLYLPDRDKSGKVRKIDQFVYELGQGAVSEIAALTISAATGGAAAPIVAPLFGIWSFGSKYAEAVGAGVDTEKAYNSATISGLVNWIGEYVQLKMFGAGKNVLASASDEVQGALNLALRDVAIKSQPQVMARVAQLTAGLGKVGTAAGKIGIKNAVGGIVNDVIENAAQEFLESAGESAGDFASGVKPLNGQTFLDATAKAFKSAAYGGILAGATSIAIGNITMNVDKANLARAQETMADAKSTLESKLQTMNFEAKKIGNALPIAAMGELQLGHGVVNTANMTASGFKTLLQTADNLAIFSVERSGQDEVLNNWGRTQEVSRIFGGVKAVLGIYEGEDGHIVHEHSFITTDVKSSMALAVAAGQESVLIKYQNAWYFVDPRTGEKIGTASGLNYAPIGAQTQVTLTGKKAMKFGFDNVQWGVETEATPALVSAIDNKSEKEFADILSAAGLAYNEQGQAVYNSGPDMATNGTIQQEVPAPLGNVAQAPVPGMSGTTAAPTGKTITFIHYSTKPGLDTLSADSMGKGRPGAEIANQVAGKNTDGTVKMLPGKLPKLAVYGKNSRPEVQFIHDNVYSVKVDEGTLYHVKDGASVPSDVELQSQGWKGLIYESDSPYFNGQARLFGDVPATYLGKISNGAAIDPRGYTAGQALISASLNEVDPFTRTRNAANAPVQGMNGTTQQGTNATLGNVAAPPTMSGTTSQFLSKNILKALPALSEMTPHDIMRWAGLTEEEIAGMSDKVVAGFAKRVETAYNVAKTKYGKNMAQVVSTMVKPYEQWGLEEYAGIREFSASILGEENVDLVTKILAATSAGMQVGANVTLTEKALRIILTEGRLPTGADGFLGAHIENMRKILAGIELPKVGEFAQAILGNEDALVMDRWMARFWFNAENPTNEQRLVAKVLTTQVAKKSGMTAREMQAAIWQYTREAAGEKKEGSFAKYGEMKVHADEIRFLQELLAKRNAVNQQSITDEAGNVNAITPFATDGAISPRAAAAALKLDKSGYNAPSSATLFYQTQYGGQQQSGTGPAPTTMTITAGGNPVLTNQQGQPVAVLPTLLKTKPIQNFASQDSLSHMEELYKDDINVLRSLGYLDGYTYQLLTVIRGSSTATEYAILHGQALLPDGMKQSFAPGVKLIPFISTEIRKVTLGQTIEKAGLTEENLNRFSILYAASRGNPVNVDSMPEVNLTKQGKGKLADKLAVVKANAIAELTKYSPEQYAILKGVMDEAHKYLTPIVNAMHAKGMPLGENLDSGAISVDEWIDSYVSSAEPSSSGIDASSPTQEKHIETVSHKQVTGYLNGIVNTMNRYNQWFQYNEYVKRFSTEMGFTSDKAVKGAPTFFADNGDVKWVDAPDHIKRQITSIVSRAHATLGLFNTDIYNNLMTASRELKLMTPAFAQTNLFRDASLVFMRSGVHPVAMANTILKLIIGKSEKSSGLVGMGTPNELTGNVFKDFQNIDHAVALTHTQRVLQYIHDNVLGISESLMRNYAYNVAKAGGKSEVEQIYALIASSADFTVYGSSETAANIRKAWQFSQASLDVTMSWDLAIKELGTKMASDNMGVKFEGFSGAALLIAGIAAGIAFKAREKERKELQDYVSQNKIPIRKGNKIITIPEGFNTGAMLENTVSTVVAGMMNGDSVGEITSGLGLDVYDGIMGMIGRDGDFTLNSIASTLTPTLFEPITRVFLNTQYGGGEIDPMTWGLNWTHYFKSTTNVAKNLAREMHDLSGGTVDISPIKMDYLVKSYLARYGTALTKMDSAGVKSAVSGFLAQQFVVPVPEGIKTQAYSDWQDGYAKIADDLAQAKKGNYPMSQLMVNDFQLLSAINKLFPKQTTAQGVFALSLYGLTVLDAYAQHRKEKVQK